MCCHGRRHGRRPWVLVVMHARQRESISCRPRLNENESLVTEIVPRTKPPNTKRGLFLSFYRAVLASFEMLAWPVYYVSDACMHACVKLSTSTHPCMVRVPANELMYVQYILPIVCNMHATMVLDNP